MEVMSSSNQLTSYFLDQKLEDYTNNLTWYHGSISKELSEKLLKSNEDGCFLVRDSASFPGDFRLCVKNKNEVVAYRIKSYHSDKLSVDDIEHFETLEDLIDAYRMHRRELCVDLTHYVLKENKVLIIKSKDINVHKSSIGEFGQMYQGSFNDRKVQLKPVQRVKDVEKMLRKSVCHENLMNVIGLTKFGKTTYLVSYYSKYSTLLDLLRTWDRTTYVRRFTYNFAFDICSGMEYLEKKQVVHRYLAARNILITWNGITKLTNFGLVEEYTDDFKHLPYRHWAPEVLIAKRYSHSADMWSFGVTLWEIFTNGSVPYTDIAYYRILKLLRTGQRLPKPNRCPSDMYETMKHCWKWKTSQRPTFNAMKKKFTKLKIELHQPNFLAPL